MYEGKPLALVVGNTDTGRTPMAAALLRRALGPHVIVQTAGVLSHAGEGATPEAQMAIEQIGLDISRHISRPLHHEQHGQAELLLALDRGAEMVLVTEFPNDPRVACLSALADLPDVLDPHRMPLGVWIAALRQLEEHVRAALPALRQRLGLAVAEPLPDSARTIERQAPASAPATVSLGQPVAWGADADMQRLMGLINAAPATNGMQHDPIAAHDGATSGALAAAPHDATTDAPYTHSDEPAVASDDSASVASRAEQVARAVRMIAAAAELPEIIDWLRLRQALVERLRAAAQQAAGPLDFTPAAVLMIEGKLAQQAGLPQPEALTLLRQAISPLDAPLAADGLATIGAALAQW
jgi:protein-tyrosine phosphatase